MANILLIIDVQKEFKDTKGKYQKCIDYIEQYKDEYDKTYATLFINNPKVNNQFIKQLKWKDCKKASIDDSIEFDTKNIDIVYKYGYAFHKDFFSAKDKITIIGCDIDACVLATCFSLWDENIEFRILKDYVYTTNKTYGWRDVENIFIRNFGNKCIVKGKGIKDLETNI